MVTGRQNKIYFRLFSAEWDQPTNDGKNHHFNAIANIPLSGSASNWEIEIAFTHTVVDVAANDANARSVDEWTTVWIRVRNPGFPPFELTNQNARLRNVTLKVD